MLVLLFIGFIRVRLLAMPLERDEGEYAYAGQLILQGIPPFELVYNMKLPGTYYAYAAGMAIFGQTTVGVHLLLLVINSLTSIFVFLLGRKISGVTAGLVACAVFALMSINPAVLGLAAHATQIVVLFAVPGILIFWRALESKQRLFYFFSGLFFGLAFLMKQPGVCFGLFGAACLLVHGLRDRSIFTRVFIGDALTYAAGLLLPFAFFCLAATVAGDFGRFWFWAFEYASYYATPGSFSDGMTHLGAYVSKAWTFYAGFLVLAGLGLFLAWREAIYHKPVLFVATLFLFSFLGTAPGMYFREHYFVLILPALALLAGLGMNFLQFVCTQNLRFVPPLLLGLVLGWNICSQAGAFFQSTPLQLTQTIYGDNPLEESFRIAGYIRDHSRPDARVAVVGSEPQIYFYAQRHSATGYIYLYPMMDPRPFASKMQHDMINEIESVKPEFMVLVMYKNSWLNNRYSDPTLLHWTEDYTQKFYEPIEAAGRQTNGQTIWISGESTRDYRQQFDEYMALYQRKPTAD